MKFFKTRVFIKIILLSILCIYLFYFFVFTSFPQFRDEVEYVVCMDLLDDFSSPLFPCSNSAIPAFNFYPAAFIHSFFHFVGIDVSVLLSMRVVTLVVGVATTYLMYVFLHKKYNDYITGMSLLVFATTPAFLQFSHVSWFNIYVVFYTLLLLLVGEKLLARFNYWSVCGTSLVIALLLQSYLAGKLVGLFGFLILFMGLKKTTQKVLFLIITVFLVLPFVITSLAYSEASTARILSVTLGLKDVTKFTFITEQVYPTLFGFTHLPYSLPSLSDNTLYTPDALGLIPFYFMPLIFFGFYYYLKDGVKEIKKNTLSFEKIYWASIFLIVFGVNLLTLYPLNISRSLLLIPLYVFFFAKGLSLLLRFKIFHSSLFRLLLSFAIIFFCFYSLMYYTFWLYGDFFAFAYFE